METKDIVTLVSAFFGSVGFWALVQSIIQGRRDKKNARYDLIENMRKGQLALLHSALYDLCDTIIEQGYKTPEQVERLSYLTPPYFGLGGDGTLEKLLKIIDGLPTKKI